IATPSLESCTHSRSECSTSEVLERLGCHRTRPWRVPPFQPQAGESCALWNRLFSVPPQSLGAAILAQRRLTRFVRFQRGAVSLPSANGQKTTRFRRIPCPPSRERGGH